MSLIIRPYKDSDFEPIAGWWQSHGAPGPVMGAMVPDGTLVADLDGEPVMSLTCFLTQSKQIALLEGFVSKPGLDKEVRRNISTLIWGEAVSYAKERGYQTVLIYAGPEGLVKRYEELGMGRSLAGLTALSGGI